MSNKVSIMQEMFKKEGSDELVPAVTIILDGHIRNIIDALSEQNGYKGYPEAISEILFKGIESMIKNKSRKENTRKRERKPLSFYDIIALWD